MCCPKSARICLPAGKQRKTIRHSNSRLPLLGILALMIYLARTRARVMGYHDIQTSRVRSRPDERRVRVLAIGDR